jgi:uncharacterized membrane protein YadS
MATSFALFAGSSVDEVMQVTGWKSESTFTTFYLKDQSTAASFFLRNFMILTKTAEDHLPSTSHHFR